MSCQGSQKCKFCYRLMNCSDLDLIEAYKELITSLEGLCEARRNRQTESVHPWLAMKSLAKKKINDLT